MPEAGPTHHHGRDYVGPPPELAPRLDVAELKLPYFYRAVVAEFTATLLFLYDTVATLVGYKMQTGPCDGVGPLGIAWTFGGMTFVLVYCTAGISGTLYDSRTLGLSDFFHAL